MKNYELVSSKSDSYKLVGSQATSSQANVNVQPTHSPAMEHLWITIVNPTNHRLLLQACDNCGVVKSENSMLRACKAPKQQQLIRGLMSVGVKQVG